MSRIATWLLVAGVLVGGVAALWLAGEMRYRNCQQDWVLARQAASANVDYGVVFGGGVVSSPTCSRLPF